MKTDDDDAETVADGDADVGLQADDSGDHDDVVKVPRQSVSELNDTVTQIGNLLKELESTDPRVWNLFCEGGADVENVCAFARELVTEDTPAIAAYAAIRYVAAQQQLKAILTVPVDARLKERRFDIEVRGFINTLTAGNRTFEPDSRPMIPLPKVLDHAAAALVRLEAMRSTVRLARESPDSVDAQTVTEHYENVLTNVTYLADSSLIDPTRTKADADVSAIVEALAAAAFVEAVVSVTGEFVEQLIEDRHLSSSETLTAALAANPLQFEDAEGPPSREPMPESCTKTCGMGEVIDGVREHVLGKVWSVLTPLHDPEDVVKRLDALLRRELGPYARIEPSKERHENNPRVALSVVSLDRLTGNAGMSHLYVRVNVEGRLIFIEDFEDGTYVDLFELHESERRQMHGRAKERSQRERIGELQLGSNYLKSLGRTNKPFGRNEQKSWAAASLMKKASRGFIRHSKSHSTIRNRSIRAVTQIAVAATKAPTGVVRALPQHRPRTERTPAGAFQRSLDRRRRPRSRFEFDLSHFAVSRFS